MLLKGAPWLFLETVDSTQSEAARQLQTCPPEQLPQAILAQEQTAGRGRYGREWLSAKGDSLAMTLILKEKSGHPRPWLFGMAAACACACVLHCRVRWPNDLYLDGKKLGGILTEIVEGVPLVGIGVNLNQQSFPRPIAESAMSLWMHRPERHDPQAVAVKIVRQFEHTPEPMDWSELAPVWDMFDETPGKIYRLPSGEEARAVGIGPHGELLCTVGGEAKTVLAAEAILAPA